MMDVFADPGSNRFYGYVPKEALGLTDQFSGRWVVMQDNTISDPLPAPIDYDALTSNVVEGPQTVSTFAGGISGFGSHLMWVGGLGAIQRSLYVVYGGNTGDTGINPGDRGAFLARVARLDVRDTGSSASAQSVAPDSGTQDEWDSRPATTRRACRDAAARSGSDPSGCTNVEPAAGQIADTAFEPWPWSAATCLDGTGDKDLNNSSEPYLGGDASVSCSLKNQKTHARAVSPGIVTSDSTLSVGSSTVDATTVRDPNAGATTTITSEAHGILVKTPAGTLSIAQVLAKATTAAHGRPGSAKATWDRHLSGIVLQTPDGATTRPPDCTNDGCQSQLLAINRALGEFARFDMPTAQLTQSPKGAFAGVQKSLTDYLQAINTQNDDTKAIAALQVQIFADREQKFRYVAQFAAVEATSIYTISALSDQQEPDPCSGDCSPDPVITPLPPIDGSTQSGQIPPDPGSQYNGGLAQALPRMATQVISFVARSPLQALQLAMVLMLFFAVPASVMRRRSFRAKL
jgi:hypothetical protein